MGRKSSTQREVKNAGETINLKNLKERNHSLELDVAGKLTAIKRNR
jgi:hypothetical protein